MIAVPLLLFVPVLSGTGVGHIVDMAAQAFLWASLIMTVYSGVEYVMKNKEVFSQ